MSQTTPLTTYSGKPVWLWRPDELELTDDDIYHGVRTALRFNGIIPSSVLLHTAIVVWLLRDDDRLTRAYGACHDLHEGIVGEWHAGLKQAVPVLKELERPWEEKVHRHFGLELPKVTYDQHRVKAADSHSVAIEMVLFEHPRVKDGLERNGAVTDEEMFEAMKLKSMHPSRLWTMVMEALKGGGGD